MAARQRLRGVRMEPVASVRARRAWGAARRSPRPRRRRRLLGNLAARGVSIDGRLLGGEHRHSRHTQAASGWDFRPGPRALRGRRAIRTPIRRRRREGRRRRERARSAACAQIECARRLARGPRGGRPRPALRARARYLEGNLEFLDGEYEDAVQAYDRALLLAPGSVDAGDSIGRDAAWNRAIALRRIEDKKDAGQDASSGDASSSDAGASGLGPRRRGERYGP